jgi:hypothetical protein
VRDREEEVREGYGVKVVRGRGEKGIEKKSKERGVRIRFKAGMVEQEHGRAGNSMRSQLG